MAAACARGASTGRRKLPTRRACIARGLEKKTKNACDRGFVLSQQAARSPRSRTALSRSCARLADPGTMSFFNSLGRSMGIAAKSKGRPMPASTVEQTIDVGMPPADPSGVAPGTMSKPLYLCQPFVRSTLIRGSFRTIVALPKYVHPYEWIAMNCACAQLTQCLTSSTT